MVARGNQGNQGQSIMDLCTPFHAPLRAPLCTPLHAPLCVPLLLKSDWLPLHDPILNGNFSPISALLRRSTYHKSAKVSPPPFPQISRAPQINE